PCGRPYDVSMRILPTGDRFWNCHVLAATILRRLVARYGPDLTIIHGESTGVDESFATAAKGLGLHVEAYSANWDKHGDAAGPIRNGDMVRSGADLCIAMHQFLANSRGTKDCVRKALDANIPTYLIDSDKLVPRRLLADDPRLS